MFPTTTNNFNRYKHNSHIVNIHQQPMFNPIADLNIPNNTTLLNPIKQISNTQPSLTKSLNKEIFHTLKNKEKEFVEEVNYYGNLNKHGLPQEANVALSQSMGKTMNRLIRGDSYAQDTGLANSSRSIKNNSMGPGQIVYKKKEDFLDRFIKRQNNWQGYYKNTGKLESLKCDQHPDFLTNSEFLPINKENEPRFDSEMYEGSKKSQLLPNSVVIDRNFRGMEVDKNWSRNYGKVLKDQQVFKDVNYMELNQYSKIAKQLDHTYVMKDREPEMDKGLKRTILNVYNQV